MLFWKADKIENCAPCHVQSQGLFIFFIPFVRLATSRPQKFLCERSRLFRSRSGRVSDEVESNKSDKGLFWKSSFLTVNQETVTWSGDLENIFSRPRPSVSRLRRRGAVRAQPWDILVTFVHFFRVRIWFYNKASTSSFNPCSCYLFRMQSTYSVKKKVDSFA